MLAPNVRSLLLPLALGLGVLGVSSPAGAQPAPAPKAAASDAPIDAAATFEKEMIAIVGVAGGLTADDVARRSIGTSPVLDRQDAEIEGAAAGGRSARLNWVPRLSVEAGYTRLSDLDPVELAPGFTLPSPILNNWAIGATVGVPISDYFLRVPKAIAAADAGTRAARLSRDAAALDVAADARLAYYDWVRARLQVVVAERLVDQIERTKATVEALEQVGRASRADVLRLDAQKAQAELALLRIVDATALYEDRLRIVIGAKASEQFTIGEDVRAPVDPGALAAAEQQYDDAMGRRLDVRAIDAATEATGHQVALTRASKLPRLDGFVDLAYDNPNQRVFPQESEFAFTWAAGVKLSWSVNDFLGTDPQVDQLRARAHGLAADRERLGHGVRIQVLSAHQAVKQAQAAAKTTARGLAAAEESYRVRRELLAADRATSVEVVDAEAELTRARIAAIDALVDLRVALVNLEHAAGLDVK